MRQPRDDDSKEEFCIIHFSHPEFQRCAIMDRHLQVRVPVRVVR